MKHTFNKDWGVIVTEPCCVAEILREIVMIGTDYDGCTTVEELKRLVDELVKYAEDGCKMLGLGKITDEDVADETRETLEASLAEQEKYLNEN